MARPDKKNIQGYNLCITSKHLQITDAIEDYIYQKLKHIDRFTDQIMDIAVTLDAQKMDQSCAILMHFIHFTFQVKSTTDNVYSAIDKAFDRAQLLIRRYKTKLQNKRFDHLSMVDIHVNVIKPLEDETALFNSEIEAANEQREKQRFECHKIVARETLGVHTLSQDEAVMKLELSDEPFLVFMSEETKKMCILYRRKDQNYNLIQLD